MSARADPRLNDVLDHPRQSLFIHSHFLSFGEMQDDRVYISGISGAFPESDSVKELSENLFAGRDLPTDDERRWERGHPEIPQRTGKIRQLAKFDASFFRVHARQAEATDPMGRLLLEKTYEALFDAGVNAGALRNTDAGVYVGVYMSESENVWMYERTKADGFGLMGCARSMLANRISYWLGCTGPSHTTDTACSSFAHCLQHAYRDIKDGRCSAAVVACSNLCLDPWVSLQYSRLGVLSAEGRCRSFDAGADGYVRSEAVVVAFLQKSQNAKRVYAEVVHARVGCDGYNDMGIAYPDGLSQELLLRDFYAECNVDPRRVAYVEAHGTGTKVGDPEELNALDAVFCTDRAVPLLVGSVKSNVGHSEAAAAGCSLAKMCIAYESGFIPPNLHYRKPRPGVPALVEGRMTVVTEATPWLGGLAGVNSFGMGGSNAHFLLNAVSVPKVNGGAPTDDLPRLVCVSGRTEAAVDRILDELESRPIDVEMLALLHTVYATDVRGHAWRGYSLIKGEGPTRVSRDMRSYSGAERPLWFVFSGMGSQWPTMGAALMRLPVFAAAVDRCHHALAPRGVDVKRIVTEPRPEFFDDVLNSFVGIAAVQVGLCDVLESVGVVPDRMIGHSVGELGCAYADKCLTAEETMLCAYMRGLVSNETPLIRGAMAAVGLSRAETEALLPPEIDVACRNGPDSCTVSGPADVVAQFVEMLCGRGVFAKLVPCSDIAYHSRYIADAGTALLERLREVIPVRRKRSAKWASTSVPQSRWGEDVAQYSSAEYYTANLLGPVLFEEASRLIEDDAVTVEIAPHGLLQAVLRRSLSDRCTNLALTRRGAPDNVECVLTALGKLYELGATPKLSKLYPEVQFPVSRGTPMLSHLVEWEHSNDWFVASHVRQKGAKSSEKLISVNVADDKFAYLSGHVVDGRNLYPATGYLAMVWETFVEMRSVKRSEASVVFESVRFLRATIIPKQGVLEFKVVINEGSGHFEIAEGGAAIVSGKIGVGDDSVRTDEPAGEEDARADDMSARDVYKELRLRGYEYKGAFRGIESCAVDGSRGRLTWTGNWTTFLDTVLQLKVMSLDTRGLYVPTRIERLSVDVDRHRGAASEGEAISATVCIDSDSVRCGGVEIKGLFAAPIVRRSASGTPVLEKYQFVANFSGEETSARVVARIAAQLLLENAHRTRVEVLECLDRAASPLIVHFGDAFDDLPLVRAELAVLSNEAPELPSRVRVESGSLGGAGAVDVLIVSGLLENGDVAKRALARLSSGGIIVSRERSQADPEAAVDGLRAVAAFAADGETLVVLRKAVAPERARFVTIRGADDGFLWIDEVKAATKESERLVLVADRDELSGILGLINCLRKEPGGELVRCLAIEDSTAPPFDSTLPLYAEQLSRGLAVNVLRNGRWGTYRHLPLEERATRPVEHAYAATAIRGDLSSLTWTEGPLKARRCERAVHVYCSALNFKDVMTASGRVNDNFTLGRFVYDCAQGMEFSGKTHSGVRIMGMVRNKGMANLVEADSHLSWPVPDDWTLEDAATVPVAYLTAFYSLIVIGRMKAGESVLIHAGTGAVGQAAISVCLHRGCRVFATVGTPAKRALLRRLFPQIPESHVGNSRDASFELVVMKGTGGRGVDLVLNSLADEKLAASVRCLAERGRFLEIGKFDIYNDSPLGMYSLRSGASVHGVLLEQLYADDDLELKKEVGALLLQGVADGSVKPLTRVSFDARHLQHAFRYMAAGKHAGKILVRIREDRNGAAPPTALLLDAAPRYAADAGKAHVIVGGLGGFGLELADWLVLRGARTLVLNSRRGIVDGYQKSRIRVWRSYGVCVVINTDDVTKRKGCDDLLRAAGALTPVGTIFNLAVALRDALFENQTAAAFAESFGPKSAATAHLDAASRRLCPELTDFVVFSSVSCGRGNAGQTNYGMTNAVMERICEERKRRGYPALAVQWGAVGDVGLLAEVQEERGDATLEIGGTLPQSVADCLRTLDRLLRSADCTVASSMVVAEKRAAGGSTALEVVAAFMGLKDIECVSRRLTLAELGMDSMISAEIKQILERDFELILTQSDIRTLTFGRLEELSSKRTSEVETAEPDEFAALKTVVQNFGLETAASEAIVRMPTALANSDDSEPLLFMIPGFNGSIDALTALSRKLECRAVAFRPGADSPDDSIADVAAKIFQWLESSLRPDANFALLGYSYGAIVALETAKLLEARGRKGAVVSVDGFPQMISALIGKTSTNIGSVEKRKLEDVMLRYMADVLAPERAAELAARLSDCGSREDKLDAFAALLPGRPDALAAARTLCGRTCAAARYSADEACATPVESPVTLLRVERLPAGVAAADDYGLGRFCRRPVLVRRLQGTHDTVLAGEDCAVAVNEALDSLRRT